MKEKIEQTVGGRLLLEMNTEIVRILTEKGYDPDVIRYVLIMETCDDGAYSSCLMPSVGSGAWSCGREEVVELLREIIERMTEDKVN